MATTLLTIYPYILEKAHKVPGNVAYRAVLLSHRLNASPDSTNPEITYPTVLFRIEFLSGKISTSHPEKQPSWFLTQPPGRTGHVHAARLGQPTLKDETSVPML